MEDKVTNDLGKCQVCDVNPAIGVASTHVPYSCAFCSECASRGSDPEWIFDYWKEECGLTPDTISLPDGFNTLKDGKYLTYREWYGLTA